VTSAAEAAAADTGTTTAFYVKEATNICKQRLVFVLLLLFMKVGHHTAGHLSSGTVDNRSAISSTLRPVTE
jgi:hypothetical protein